jgi:hypothetical protein
MKDRILALLGNGVAPEATAAAVGCTPAYISQLLKEPDFAAKVAELRCANLTQATERDGKYDTLEDKLLAKLEDLIPFMIKPMEVVKALSAMNSAKRRGAGAESSSTVNNIVVLQLPQVIKNRFQVNDKQEVVEVDGRTLLTIDGSKLLKELKNATTNNRALASAEI